MTTGTIGGARESSESDTPAYLQDTAGTLGVGPRTASGARRLRQAAPAQRSARTEQATRTRDLG